MKNRKAEKIKNMLDELQKNIVVENEIYLMILQGYERIENRTIEENTDAAVKKIKQYVYSKKTKFIN